MKVKKSIQSIYEHDHSVEIRLTLVETKLIEPKGLQKERTKMESYPSLYHSDEGDNNRALLPTIFNCLWGAIFYPYI